MKLKAILSRTTTDQMKSKMMSTEVCQLVFDVYMSPTTFAKLVEEYYDNEFLIEVKHEKTK